MRFYLILLIVIVKVYEIDVTTSFQSAFNSRKFVVINIQIFHLILVQPQMP
jgi:hypothetical protein